MTQLSWPGPPRTTGRPVSQNAGGRSKPRKPLMTSDSTSWRSPRVRTMNVRFVAVTMALAAASALSCARRVEPPLWKAVEIPTDADFVGAWFADSLNGWISGGGWAIDGGILGRTRDGGRTWR